MAFWRTKHFLKWWTTCAHCKDIVGWGWHLEEIKRWLLQEKLTERVIGITMRWILFSLRTMGSREMWVDGWIGGSTPECRSAQDVDDDTRWPGFPSWNLQRLGHLNNFYRSLSGWNHCLVKSVLKYGRRYARIGARGLVLLAPFRSLYLSVFSPYPSSSSLSSRSSFFIPSLATDHLSFSFSNLCLSPDATQRVKK